MIIRYIILIFLATISFLGVSQEKNDLYFKAEAYEKQANYQEAVLFYNKFIELDSTQFNIYLKRADNYFQLSEFQQSLKDYKKAENLNAVEGTYGIARCYAMLGEKQKMFESLENHLKQKEKQSQASIKLDTVFEKYHETIEWKSLWMKDWYSQTEMTIFDAEYLMSKALYVDAIEILDAFLEKSKRNHYAFYLRAMASKALGNNKGSISDLTLALAISKKNDLYFFERANLYLLDKKFKKALEDYNSAIAFNSLRIDYYFNRMIAQYNLNEYDKALDDVNLYLKYYPVNDLANYYCGLIYFAQEDMHKALEYVNYALHTNTGNADYFLLRGNAYYLTSSYELADKDFSMVLDLNPKVAEAYFFRAMCRFELGNNDGACSDWEKAFNLHYIDADEYLRKHCWKNY